MKYFYALLLLLLGLATQAQSPNWQPPNPSQFSGSMTVTARLQVDGSFVNSPGDTMAFFINNELRGLAPADLIEVGAGNQEAYFFATVFGNDDNGEEVTIQVYRTDDDMLFDAANRLTYVTQSTVGDFDDPYLVFLGDVPNNGELQFATVADQETVEGFAFTELDLADFVTATDGPVIYTLSNGQPGATYAINGTMLQVAADGGFVGDAGIDVTVTDVSGRALTQTIVYRVLAEFDGPLLRPLPTQTRLTGTPFADVDLRNFTDTRESTAQTYFLTPALAQIDLPAPAWFTPTNFAGSMDITATVEFTQFLTFDNPDDQLGAFVNGELRGGSFSDIIDGRRVHFLTIATNGTPGEEFELRFYDADRGAIYTHPFAFPVVFGGQEGTVDNPRMYDFSPLDVADNTLPILDVSRRDPDFLGEQTFIVTVADARVPRIYRDSGPITYRSVSVLPVDLLSFRAAPGKDAVALRWEVSQEDALLEYTVERRTLGSSFKAVGSVSASAANAYELVDRDVPVGTLYYRLVMRDLDGTERFSKVVQAHGGGGSGVYPNPAGAGTTLNVEAAAGSWFEMYDSQGRIRFRGLVDRAGQLSLAALPPGVYFYRADGRTGRLIIE